MMLKIRIQCPASPTTTAGLIQPRRSNSQELRAEVRRALAQLDEHHRLVLTLYYFDDMKYTDIAEVLDIPLNTVKSHIRRGKERLAAILTAQEQPPTALAVAQPPRQVDQQQPRMINPFMMRLSPFGRR